MMNFKNIGIALRWLRTQRFQKQRDVAKIAGITPAMLSAYETGKHRPSLDTTERVLKALGCDVVDLTNALQLAASQERELSEADGSSGKTKSPPPLDFRLQSFVRESLDGLAVKPEEEQVLASLLPGLLQLIRYLKG